MRTSLLVCAAVQTAIACGCTSYRAQYNIALAKVVATDAAGKTLAPGTITADPMHGLAYRDGLLGVVWIMGDYDANLSVENLTGEPIAVVWDRCVYTDVTGAAHKLASARGDPAQIGQPQAPTAIAPGKVERRFVKPADYTVRDNDSWRSLPLLPCCGGSLESLEEEVAPYVGKSFEFSLAIEKGSEAFEYAFDFVVDGVPKVRPMKTHF